MPPSSLAPSPAQPPAASSTNWKLVVGIIAAVLLLLCGTPIAIFAWLVSAPESGVKLPNEMDDYAIRYLADHKLLEEGEELRAYYDATIAMDGTEALILTDRRVMHHKGGRTTAVALRDIESVDHHKEGLVGDVIQVKTRSGVRMKLEVAPLNGGEVFLAALRDQVARARRAPLAVEAP